MYSQDLVHLRQSSLSYFLVPLNLRRLQRLTHFRNDRSVRPRAHAYRCAGAKEVCGRRAKKGSRGGLEVARCAARVRLRRAPNASPGWREKGTACAARSFAPSLSLAPGAVRARTPDMDGTNSSARCPVVRGQSTRISRPVRVLCVRAADAARLATIMLLDACSGSRF